MNGKFFALPQERQEQIINAAYEVFSRNSYKNASMSRLADAAEYPNPCCFIIS